MPLARIKLLILALALFIPPLTAFALECDGGIIEIGDGMYEVKKKCGKPVWQNPYSETHVQKLSDDSQREYTVNLEEWLYNFGPDRFMQLLTFRGNRLIAIDTRNYGYPDQQIDTECNGRTPEIGEIPGEILLKCGKPASQEQWQEEMITVTSRVSEVRSPIIYDQWVYNTAPGHFKYILKFKNARLIDIKTGDYSR